MIITILDCLAMFTTIQLKPLVFGFIMLNILRVNVSLVFCASHFTDRAFLLWGVCRSVRLCLFGLLYRAKRKSEVLAVLRF